MSPTWTAVLGAYDVELGDVLTVVSQNSSLLGILNFTEESTSVPNINSCTSSKQSSVSRLNSKNGKNEIMAFFQKICRITTVLKVETDRYYR